MKQVTITDRASKLVEAYRDEEYTDHIKASLFDTICRIIDEANANDCMNCDTLHMLAAISDLNELITEFGKTRDE